MEGFKDMSKSKLTGKKLPSIGDPDMESLNEFARENPEQYAKMMRLVRTTNGPATARIGKLVMMGTAGDMSVEEQENLKKMFYAPTEYGFIPFEEKDK